MGGMDSIKVCRLTTLALHPPSAVVLAIIAYTRFGRQIYKITSAHLQISADKLRFLFIFCAQGCLLLGKERAFGAIPYDELQKNYKMPTNNFGFTFGATV
jgi:hypothetical protein